jgi:hypothetical protein
MYVCIATKNKRKRKKNNHDGKERQDTEVLVASLYTDAKADPPARASNVTTSSRPITLKKALGLEKHNEQ